ncbi:uncharacterized protein LOC126687895 [Mercurialis annua]|uniref:uncharacterized protein LOC126687895 n=1 Tax=Mercurialis annua TaxID=3986 RepID=UPI0021601DAF|nr:uncharacterized protein LOC126687895 [Mercurialis annua]
MESYVWQILILGVISWTTLFLFMRKILPNHSFDFCKSSRFYDPCYIAVTLASLSVHNWRRPITPLASKCSPSQSGTELVSALWLTEISSPFLHLRELLKELGYRNTDLNLAADISFAVIFTFGRMIFGPYLTYATLTADNPLIIQVMSFGLQMVSAFWFYKIIRIVNYKLASSKTASKKFLLTQKLN